LRAEGECWKRRRRGRVVLLIARQREAKAMGERRLKAGDCMIRKLYKCVKEVVVRNVFGV
jgi:hypothetical protein